MSDPGAIPLGLQQQEVAHKIDPEQLESMGKRAAALFSSQGTPLNEAVVSIVKEARLAPEQVKRVCEFANTATYLDEFEKAGEVRNVEFPLADPGVVLKDLNDGSSPAVHQASSGDYSPPGDSYKVAGMNMLKEAFGSAAAGMEKTASVRSHSSRENPAEEVDDLRIRLEGAQEHLISKLSSSAVVLEESKTLLKEATAKAVLDGTPMGDIVRAWSNYGDADSIKEASSLVKDYLQERAICDADQFSDSLTKTASSGVVANPSHPLVDNFRTLTKVAFEHAKLEKAVDILGERISETRASLRRML